jgi:hypothetical protein
MYLNFLMYLMSQNLHKLNQMIQTFLLNQMFQKIRMIQNYLQIQMILHSLRIQKIQNLHMLDQTILKYLKIQNWHR